MVGVEVVFISVHQRGCLGHQRRAHCIGAFGRLRPIGPWRQGHLGRALEKIIVTNGMQDGARGIGEHHHAGGVDDLLVQHFHHRCSMVVQAHVALARDRQIGHAQG